jgi:hypothetical protein
VRICLVVMRTKSVHLKTGNTATLYFSEGLNKWVADYGLYLEHRTNFERLKMGDLNTSSKMMSSIVEFYNATSEMNRKKVKTMINESAYNIPVVYDMLLTTKINRKRG